MNNAYGFWISSITPYATPIFIKRCIYFLDL